MSALPSRSRRYALAYARLREREGRGGGGEAELLSLPHLGSGPMAAQWRVRSRTYAAFLTRVVLPLERERGRPLRVLDLGAGNGWLCYRMAQRALGAQRAPQTPTPASPPPGAVAVDIRMDGVDGLGAGAAYSRHLAHPFGRVAASFEALPLASHSFDLVVFNASLHYAEDLPRALSEAARAASPRGRLVILDSPFYRRKEAGEEMVEEKRRATRQRFDDLAEDLLALRPIEFLTRRLLDEAARPLGLSFRRHRVLYPLWYELRPLKALLARHRPPSRFDLWEAEVP